MKKLTIGFLSTIIAAIAIAAQSVPSRVVTLKWWNNNSIITDGVKLYYTTNIATPTNQWPLLVYIPNPIPVASNYFEFSTNLTANNYYFVGTFTNTYWSLESFFSNGTNTVPIPTNTLTGLSIKLP